MPLRLILAAGMILGWILKSTGGAAPLASTDWAMFGGPNGDGTSSEHGLMRTWEKGGPPVVWRAPIKQGWGAPSIAGNDIYFGSTEQLNGGQETIVCLATDSGKERWHYTYDVGPYWERNIGWPRGGFRGTPLVTDKFVVTLGAVGHLHCLDRSNGQVIWKKNLYDEFVPAGEKGCSFSPVLAGGVLVLWYGDGTYEAKDPDHHFVLCRGVRLETGEVLWTFREPHRDPARMGEGQTPAVANFAGDPCVVVTANCELKALRASDGKPVWMFDCIKHDARSTTIPTPLILDRYIVDIPDQDAAHVVEVDREHLEKPTRVVWKKDINVFCAIHQFRHHDGFLYGFTGEMQGESEQTASDSKMNLVCIELATGKIRWTQPNFKTGVAIIEADGLLFVRTYQTLRLIEATPDGYHVLGEVHTHNNRKASQNLTDFVSPILSRGKLYVRTPGELICYQVAR